MMKPQPGSKPSPVTPEQAAALAKAKADTAEITLDRYRAMCTTAGVVEVRLIVERDGLTITLRGHHKDRHVAVDVKCPWGHPFPLYAMRALEEFKTGRGKPDEGDLDTATGEQLDAVGRLLGIERMNGEDDESYRMALRRETRYASLGSKQTDPARTERTRRSALTSDVQV